MTNTTDISMTFAEPLRGFGKEIAKTKEKEGWNASTLTIYSHAGTHMDAPLHFAVNETSIDQIPVERFLCNAHIVRLENMQASQLIAPESIGLIKDRIEPGDAVIFNTGWSRYSDNQEVYRNQLPRISKELAQLLVELRVNLIGVEPPSIADVNNIRELTEVHEILMQGDVLILEGLCNLEAVQSDQGKLLALPLKIGGGDGAPVRAVFIED